MEDFMALREAGAMDMAGMDMAVMDMAGMGR